MTTSGGEKKEIENVSLTQDSKSVKPRMLGNISENQLNIFLSARKFEKKNFVKIGRVGVTSQTLTVEYESKKEYLNQITNLINQEDFRVASQYKIPASIPLKLPDSIKRLIRENKVDKISIAPNLPTNSVKITLMDKTGNESIIVTSQENRFKNHSLKGSTMGLSISDDSRLLMSIPLSPPSVESIANKNQGDVLYKISLEGVAKKNV